VQGAVHILAEEDSASANIRQQNQRARRVARAVQGADNAAADREVFLRWAQLGALCPIMENGGVGEHRPWTFDPEVVAIYRTFVKLHHELIPYLYGQGARACEKETSLMQFRPVSNDYLLGDSFFVSPDTEAGTTREITFPAGRWIDWLDESRVYEGPSTQTLEFPLDRFPVFVRDPSIVPLTVENNATGHGGSFSQGHLTVAVSPALGGEIVFDLYEENGNGIRFRQKRAGTRVVLESWATGRPLLWRVRGMTAVGSVHEEFGAAPVEVGSLADLATAPRTWFQDAQGVNWISIQDPAAGLRLSIEPG